MKGAGRRGPKGVGPEGRLVATFCSFRAVSATEKLATIIDSLEFCTACHAEGRGFDPVAPAISTLALTAE